MVLDSKYILLEFNLGFGYAHMMVTELVFFKPLEMYLDNDLRDCENLRLSGIIQRFSQILAYSVLKKPQTFWCQLQGFAPNCKFQV